MIVIFIAVYIGIIGIVVMDLKCLAQKPRWNGLSCLTQYMLRKPCVHFSVNSERKRKKRNRLEINNYIFMESVYLVKDRQQKNDTIRRKEENYII